MTFNPAEKSVGKQRHLWAAIGFAALEILYFLPMLWGWHGVPFHLLSPRFTGVDYQRRLPQDLNTLPGHDPSGVIIDYPSEYYAAERIGRLELPWWNPRVGMGRPWLGNGHIQPLSPLLAPFWLHPNPWTYTLQWVLGTIVSMLGVYWLLVLMDLPSLMAFLGAGLWTWNPFTEQKMFMNMAGACWWWPLALAGICFAIKKKSMAGWLISACAFALTALCGHVETAVYMAEMAGLVILCVGWGHRRTVRPMWILAGLAICVLVAALLSAAQWYPILEVAKDAGSYKTHGLLNENKLPGLATVLSGWGSDVFLLPVLLGSTILAVKRRSDWRVIALVSAFLFCLCLSVPWVANTLPFRLLRWNGVMTPGHGAELAAFPLAGLAVLGLATLLGQGEEPGPFRRWTALALSALLTLWALSRVDLSEGRWVPAVWLLAMAAVFAACLFPPPRVRRGFLLTALGLMALLYPLARGRFLYPSFGGSPPPRWTFLEAGQGTGRTSPQGRFWAPVSERTGAPLLTPNLGLLSELSDVRSTQVLNPPGSEAFSQSWGPSGYISLIIYTYSDATPELLSFLGVNRVALPDPQDPHRFIARTMEPGPRAFFVKDVVSCQDDKKAVAAFRRLLSEGALHRQAVILAGPEAKRPQPAPEGGPDERASTVTWEENSPEHQVLLVEAPTAGLLVVLDAANHLWKARVDGKNAPLLRTDVMFRGVALTAGRHRVEMTYDTRLMRLAVAVTFAAWFAALTGLVLLSRRRRHAADVQEEKP